MLEAREAGCVRCHVSATDLGSTLGGAGSFLIRADAVIGVDGIAPRRPHIFLSGTICLAGFVTYHKELSSGCTSSKILLPLRLWNIVGLWLSWLLVGKQSVLHSPVLAMLQCCCYSASVSPAHVGPLTRSHRITQFLMLEGTSVDHPV